MKDIPAFPCTHPDFATFGMTLRDYYIVHAPAEEIAEMIPDTVNGAAKYIGVPVSDYDLYRDYIKVLAKARCEWADAMLKAREAK
jgi:hypothetical protein